MKTYLEQASDLVTAMITRGYIRVIPDKGEDWKKINHKSIHTIGWAVEEMMRELQTLPEKIKKPRAKSPEKPNARIIITNR